MKKTIWNDPIIKPAAGLYVIIHDLDTDTIYRWYVPKSGRNKGKLTGCGYSETSINPVTHQLRQWRWAYWHDYIAAFTKYETALKQIAAPRPTNTVFKPAQVAAAELQQIATDALQGV